MNKPFYFQQNPIFISVPFSQGALSVIEMRLIPESQPSFQVSNAPYRVYRVLEGAVEVVINGTEKHALNAHDLLAVSDSDNSLVRSLSRSVTSIEIISASDSLERFVRAVGNTKPNIEVPEDADKIATELGMEVHTPPLPAPLRIQPYRIPVNQLHNGFTRSI